MCIVDLEIYQEMLLIGKLILNIEILILNEVGMFQFIGIVGEFCIVGISLVRGYYNWEFLIYEKFVLYLYDVNKWMYKIGDFVCYFFDGNIEYVGRMDY